MDKRYPSNADPRPKRRKDKHNPYTIYSVGSKTNDPHFYVSFEDSEGNRICIEVSKEVFQLLNQFELEDLSYLNEIDRHYEHLKFNESALYKQTIHNVASPEDTFIYDDLYVAINELPEKQRKRLTLYYFHNLTLEEIARLEGVSFQTINKSIAVAIKKLYQIL